MGKDNFFSNFASKLPFNYNTKAAEVDNEGNIAYWYWLNEACRSFFSPNECERLSEQNAYRLAWALSEIYFPIDAIADRVAALPFLVVNAEGEITEPPIRIRELLETPNPFATFSTNMYDAVFNELADGNNYIYVKTPKSFKSITPDTITGVYVLRPDKVDINIKQSRPKYFDAAVASDLIESYGYNAPGDNTTEKLPTENIIHERSVNMREQGGLKAGSPLMAVKRNVDDLIAVYEARYKVYVHNGVAGILARKLSTKGDDVNALVNDPVTRDSIMADLKLRTGLTGNKNITAISSVPLEFIRTLATISELQPFDETRADALQIAGVYGVDKDLTPFKDGTTFTNKEQAEKNLYQNVVIGVANDKARTFTKAYALDKVGLRLMPDFSGVPVLQEDRQTGYKGDAQLIDNILKLKESGVTNDADTTSIINAIIERYKNGQI
jgi:hypothetical protein